MGQGRELGREHFLLIFQRGELHLHEFVVVERFVQAHDEGVAQARVADASHGFEKLAQAFEVADLFIVQLGHDGRMREGDWYGKPNC